MTLWASKTVREKKQCTKKLVTFCSFLNHQRNVINVYFGIFFPPSYKQIPLVCCCSSSSVKFQNPLLPTSHPFYPVFFSTFQMSPATQHMQPTQTLQSPTGSGGRRRRVVDEDPDERRRKFLERNRAAATRCRQKRKVWVMSLEKKAEELTQTNMQLQVY